MDRLPDITQPFEPPSDNEEEEVSPEIEPVVIEEDNDIFVKPTKEPLTPPPSDNEEEDVSPEIEPETEKQKEIQEQVEELRQKHRKYKYRIPPEKKKIYNQRDAQKSRERWQCECGQTLAISSEPHIHRHMLSGRHLKRMEDMRRKAEEKANPNLPYNALIRKPINEKELKKKHFEEFKRLQEEEKQREIEEAERKKKEEAELEKKYFEKFQRQQEEERQKVKNTNQMLNKPDDYGQYSSYF